MSTNLEYMFHNTFPIGKVTMIARVCHEANKAYCEAIGDHSLKSWEASPEWQKHSSVNDVIYKLKNLNATPEDMHISWMKDKQTAGWKYGLVKDEVKKEHPCMVEYSQLPVEQRAKDHIFGSIVKSLSHLVDHF